MLAQPIQQFLRDIADAAITVRQAFDLDRAGQVDRLKMILLRQIAVIVGRDGDLIAVAEPFARRNGKLQGIIEILQPLIDADLLAAHRHAGTSAFPAVFQDDMLRDVDLAGSQKEKITDKKQREQQAGHPDEEEALVADLVSSLHCLIHGSLSFPLSV